MKLSDLLEYSEIWIQCHDNPDPDTIGSGYALYLYFKAKDKDVNLFYSGKNVITKSNIRILTESLEIPLKYLSPGEAARLKVKGLLLTVDCQYGSGNVTHVDADHIATIDHHPMESGIGDNIRINAGLGSCATLVWQMLCEEKSPIIENRKVCTALYYALYTDTNQFSELFGSDDLDMRDSLVYDGRLIEKLRKTNLSLKELEIAGAAMKNYFYDKDNRYAIIKTLTCDPNVLGLIADFLMQVGEIDICVVYNEIEDGYKLSVRSCISQVNSNELAETLTDQIGTGGGHYEKAGGFISKRLYESKYGNLDTDEYFKICLTEYCESFEMIMGNDYRFPKDKTLRDYKRIDRPFLIIMPENFLNIGEMVTLRWGKISQDLEVVGGEFWSLEQGGYVQRLSREIFYDLFKIVNEPISEDFSDIKGLPTVRSWADGKVYSIAGYATVCRPKKELTATGMKLTRNVKLFPEWAQERYITGYSGDYIMCGNDKYIFIEPGRFFDRNYVPADTVVTSN